MSFWVYVVGFVVVAIPYVIIVFNKVNEANSLLDKTGIVADAQTTWQKIDAKLLGWKTVILTWLASVFGAVAAIPTDVVDKWTGLPWSSVVDQKVAALIAIGLTMLSSVTHAFGFKTAASIPPTQDGSS